MACVPFFVSRDEVKRCSCFWAASYRVGGSGQYFSLNPRGIAPLSRLNIVLMESRCAAGTLVLSSRCPEPYLWYRPRVPNARGTREPPTRPERSTEGDPP